MVVSKMTEFIEQLFTTIIPFALFMTFFVSLPMMYPMWYSNQKKKGSEKLNYVNYLVWIKRNL